MSEKSPRYPEHDDVMSRIRLDVGDSTDIHSLVSDLMDLHVSLRPAFTQWVMDGTIDYAPSVRGHSLQSLRESGMIESTTQGFWWLNLLASEPQEGERVLKLLEAPEPFRDGLFDVPTPDRLRPKY